MVLFRMDLIRDPDDHDELARIARAKAEQTSDFDLAVRLRDIALKHELTARKLRRQAASIRKKWWEKWLRR